MKDQICSPEKYWMKNSCNKNIFYLNEKKYIYMIKMFLTEYKFILTEWKYILISWKKDDIMKIYFIEYKVILIEWKYIFISYEFSFLQHFSNHKWILKINCKML